MVEDWAKTCLACPVTTTQTSGDATGAVQAAIGQAELLLGCSLLQDCTDPFTGELVPLVNVTDNGPAYRLVGFAKFIASRPELVHVRTRHRSPGDQRRHRTVLPGHQVRRPVPPRHPDGLVLAKRVTSYLTVYNTIRPHEAVGFDVPLTRYLQAPSTPPGANLHVPKSVSDS